jgi:hypothetical protein
MHHGQSFITKKPLYIHCFIICIDRCCNNNELFVACFPYYAFFVCVHELIEKILLSSQKVFGTGRIIQNARVQRTRGMNYTLPALFCD